LDKVKPDHLKKFLVVNSPNKAYSTLSGFRSAFRYAFVQGKRKPPSELSDQLEQFYTGLKRSANKTRAEQGIREGKEAMPFDVYRAICGSWLQSMKGHELWGHAYAVVSWNLMCRTNNVASISLTKIEVRDDSVCVAFTHTKTDQAGERMKDPIHLYANPYQPEVCPFLAIGIHFARLGSTCGAAGELFPNTHQDNRFGHILHGTLKNDEVVRLLTANSLKANAIGTHSLRKGAITYVTSGSTAGPQFAAICQRAAWKLGTVQDKYLRYEAAGDMYTGRTVSGLPLHSADFAILPPHFPTSGEAADLVNELINDVFDPSLVEKEHILGVLRLCLASVVHHLKWLQDNVSQDSPLWTCGLLRDTRRLERLQEHVIFAFESEYMKPTGIPPHVSLMREMRDVKGELMSLKEAVTLLSEKPHEPLLKKIDELLEKRALDQGNMTPNSVLERMDGIVTMRMDQIAQQIGVSLNHGNNGVEPMEAAPADDGTTTGWTWGGRMHPVPRGWTLPKKCSVLDGWKLWNLGKATSTARYTPYRNLIKDDFICKTQRDKLSEWRGLYCRMVKYLRKVNKWNPDASEQGVTEMYATCRPFLAKLSRHHGDRVDAKQVSTVVRAVRGLKKEEDYDRMIEELNEPEENDQNAEE
jgi:hypothetical protein